MTQTLTVRIAHENYRRFMTYGAYGGHTHLLATECYAMAQELERYLRRHGFMPLASGVLMASRF